jgi:hypothetical protein
MDPFIEKQLIDSLKSIATSLEGIRKELADVNLSVKQAREAQEVEYEYVEEDEDEDDDSDDEDEYIEVEEE